MGIYISSKGEEKDTSTMAYKYLQSALKKAEENGHAQNIAVLTEEMVMRDAEAAKTGVQGV